MRTKLTVLHILALIINVGTSFAQQNWNIDLVGKAMYDGRLVDFVIEANYSVVATTKNNPSRTVLASVDMTNPLHPIRMEGEYEEEGFRGFLRIDSLLIMSTHGETVLYRIRQPGLPTEIARFDDSLEIGLMKEFNGYVISAFQGYLKIIDIGDLENPEIVSIITAGRTINDFAFYENYALLLETHYSFYSNCFLEIYDLSNIHEPVMVFSSELDGSRGTLDLEIIEDYAYIYQSTFHGIGYFNGIKIYDLTDPSQPEIVNNVFQEYYFQATELGANHLYAGLFDFDRATLLTINISNPVEPFIEDGCSITTPAIRIRLSNNRLGVRTAGGILTMLDVSDPGRPIIEGRYIPGCVTWGVARWENYAYLPFADGLFVIVDISDPVNPVGVNYYSSWYQTRSVFVNNGLLFLGDAQGGAPIFSLENPLNPELITTVLDDCNVDDVYVFEDLLYITTIHIYDPIDGFWIFDISDPYNPDQLGHYPSATRHNAYHAIIANGNTAYTAESDSGIGIYDVSDPSSPELIARYRDTVPARGLGLEEDVLYVPDWNTGLLTIDVSDPMNPLLMGVGECENAYTVYIDEHIAYVVNFYNRIIAFDISDPYSPQLVGSYEDAQFYTDIYAQNDTILVAAGDTGFRILCYDETVGIKEISTIPSRFQLSQNHPNPFNALTTISYSLPEASDVCIEIYNILGQQLETLFEGTQQAGRHSITWDASDFPSGIYFARLETGRYSESIKLILLK